MAQYIVGAIFLALFILAVRRVIKRGSCEQCHGDCGCGHCHDRKPPSDAILEDAKQPSCPHCKK